MKTSDLDYDLPEPLIAKYPLASRDGSRLLVVAGMQSAHRHVRDLPELIRPGDLVVVNTTKVRRARLLVSRPGLRDGIPGGRVELLFLESRPGESETRASKSQWVVLGKANRPLKPGDELIDPELSIRVIDVGEGGTRLVEIEGDVERVLESRGQVPLPPYMGRESDGEDVGRYQTVFAEKMGSAAAPTAGLHFTEELLERVRGRGARLGQVTLHVGLGTFRPVTAPDLNEHPMHSEWFEIPSELSQGIDETRQRGGRVIAIGTTVLRALESAADPKAPGRVVAQQGLTRLLIQPGYHFKVVDALFTNFHQPKSTLMALVAAFAGLETIRSAYAEAIAQEYRFLSYGDAMWLGQRSAP